MKQACLCIATAIATATLTSTTNAAGLDKLDPTHICRERIGFFQPSAGVVSTPRIAKEVAFLYLHQVYPREPLRPLSAKLDKGVWYVDGYFPKGEIGGTAHLEMCQSDGRVVDFMLNSNGSFPPPVAVRIVPAASVRSKADRPVSGSEAARPLPPHFRTSGAHASNID